MKQVIPSLERLWTPPASAASFTTAQRKNIRTNLTCCTCKVKHCHRGVQYLGNTLFVISTCIAEYIAYCTTSLIFANEFKYQTGSKSALSFYKVAISYEINEGWTMFIFASKNLLFHLHFMYNLYELATN